MELKDIKHLAMLARIEVPEDEQIALLKDLQSTLAYVDQVTRAIVSSAEINIPEQRNVCREDVVTNPSGSCSVVLMSEVPEKEKGFVKVKKILG